MLALKFPPGLYIAASLKWSLKNKLSAKEFPSDWTVELFQESHAS